MIFGNLYWKKKVFSYNISEKCHENYMFICFWNCMFYGKSLYSGSTRIELVKTIMKEVFISIFTLYRNYRHFSSKNLKIL